MNVNLTKPELIALLRSLIRSRPGIDPNDYGSWADYRREAAEVTRDLTDAETLLRYVELADINADAIVTALSGGGRLTMNADGSMDCTTGQYYPTEYRPAVSRLCAVLLRSYWYEANSGCAKPLSVEARARSVFGSRSRIVRFYF